MTGIRTRPAPAGTDRPGALGSHRTLAAGSAHPRAPSSAGPALKAFAVAVFVHSWNAGFGIAPGVAGPLPHLLWLLLYAVAALLLLDGVLRLRQGVPWSWGVLGFVAIVAASVTWSEAPAITGQSAVHVLGTVLIGLLFAQRLQPVEVLDALAWAIALIAVSSLALYAAGDPRALDPAHGTLRGVLVAKNSLGGALAFGLFAAALSAHLRPARWWLRALAAVPMAAALSLTDSANGVTLAVLVVALVGALRLQKRSPIALAAVAALVVPLLALALFGPERVSGADVTGLVGRDTTLTSRTDIWAEGIEAVEQRPLLGYGYDAFWDDTAAGANIKARLNFDVAHGHNGFLDVALGLGLLGVAVAVGLLAELLRAGVRDLRAGDTERGTVRLGVLLLALASTAVETGLLSDKSTLTVLVVASVARTAGPAVTGSGALARRP